MKNSRQLIKLSASKTIFLFFAAILFTINSQESFGQCMAPGAQVPVLTFGTINATSIQLNTFTSPMGGADGYVIKVNTSSSFSAPANSGTLPIASTNYSSGEQVVYAGPSNAGVTVTGLSAVTTYYFTVYAYNLCTGTYTYETVGTSASQATTKIDQTITFGALVTKTYGDVSFALGATASSGLPVTFASSDNLVASVTGNTVTIVGAGTADITASQAGDATYSPAPDVIQILAVDKATLTASADDKLRVFGVPNPDLTISYSGFKNGEQENVIDVKPTATTTATTTTNPGTVPIILTGGSDNNYDFNLINGTLTIINAPIRALAGDGSSSQEMAPQGALRYQRHFYLITPQEMAKSELVSDSLINSIGFTMVEAQSVPTMGNLKVYLANTDDIHSRLDTGWTTVSTTINHFDATGLSSGDYEWQVQAVCTSGSSGFTDLAGFSTADTTVCNQPANLIVDGLTTNSAHLHWTQPASAGFTQYLIRYSEAVANSWDTVYTMDTFYTIMAALSPNTQYQVRVQSLCFGGASDESAAFFSTLNTSSCNTPGGLTIDSLKNNSVLLLWTGASAATYYELEYRRSGTINWISLISFTDSIFISGLSAGTPYEWRIRTACTAGRGDFIAGPVFMTTGPPPCYAPRNLRTNVVNDTSAILVWDSIPGAVSYNLRFRLKNTISWMNAISSMKLVHNDSIKIPNNIGAFRIPFKGPGTDTIHYGGNGLYVAFEYSNSGGPLSSFNRALATSANNNIKGKDGQDSVTFVLSLATNNEISANSHKEILRATELRPETWLGSNGLRDSVEIATVYALGHHALTYSDTAEISALIINHSDVVKNYEVFLHVKEQGSGTLLHSDSQNVMVSGDDSTIVHFDSWVPNQLGTDSIIISVIGQGNENVIINNRNYYLQQVNRSTMAYDDGSAASNRAGFGTTSGLILSRLKMDGCGSVNAARIYLDFSAKGKPLYAVIMDASYTLIDSSEVFTPDSTEVNRYHTFYFPETPFFENSDYYVGLAQISSGEYYPVGVQWETNNIRDSAYYRANVNGTGLINNPYPGRLMIQAELVPGRTLPVIRGDTILCFGTTDTLRVGSKISRFANHVVDVSSEYSNTDFSSLHSLGSPNLYPGHGLSSGQWIGSTEDGQREYIVLEFSNPGPINFIDIYQTLNPGAIDSVFVKDNMGAFVPVYADTAKASESSAVLKHISFDTTTFDVSEIRITLASDSVPGFNGIDAVAIGMESDTSNFVSYQWSTSATTQSIQILGPGTYTVTVTDAFGCQTSDSIVVNTPSQDPTVLSVVNALPTTFCQGDSITLKSNKMGSNFWNTGATTDSIVVNSAGIYFLDFNDGSGCIFQRSDTITVMLDTLPVPVISGTLGFCPGGSTTLDAGTGYNSYIWSNLATTPTILVNSTEAFTVKVTDANGCSGTSPEITTFNTSPIAPVITGDLSVCPGDSTILDVGTYNTYSWSTGETTQTIFAGASETVFVTVTDFDGCIGNTSATTYNAPPLTPSISGNLSFCPGDSTMLDAGIFDTYSWSGGQTSQTIFVSDEETVYLTVTDSKGCSGSTLATTSIFIPPNPIINGNLSFCPGDSTILDVGAYNSYYWSTGESSQTIFVKTATTTMVTVTDGNGCSNSTDVTTSLFPVPVPAVFGDLGFCPGGSTTLSAQAGFSSYLWSTNSNISSTSISISGSYSVTVTDGNGCAGTNTVSVDQYDPPEPFISGTLSFCGGSSTQLNAGGGYLSYSWSSGETSQAIFVQNPDTYSVTVTDIRGCLGDTSVIVTESGSVPERPGPISGPTSVTGNPTLIEYSIDPVSNTAFYVWTVPEGVTVIGDDEGTTIMLRIDSFSLGQIVAEAANACGLSASTNASMTLLQPPSFGDCNQSQFIMDSNPIPTGIYFAQTISSAGVVQDDSYVIFRPENEIHLNINFNVELGAIFEIHITDCGNSSSMQNPAEFQSGGVN